MNATDWGLILAIFFTTIGRLMVTVGKPKPTEWTEDQIR